MYVITRYPEIVAWVDDGRRSIGTVVVISRRPISSDHGQVFEKRNEWTRLKISSDGITQSDREIGGWDKNELVLWFGGLWSCFFSTSKRK